MDILKKIEKYREEEQRLKWEGTFADYLEIIKENPMVAPLSVSVYASRPFLSIVTSVDLPPLTGPISNRIRFLTSRRLAAG